MAVDRRNRGVLVEFQPMSPEDMERTVQFLLHQQAQFAGDIEKLSAKTDLLADGLIGLTGLVGRVTEGLAEQMAIGDQQLQQRLEETDRRLSEHIGTVESHLNVVIQMFERHLREDHGQERP
jgi:hypothetical protein